MKRKVTWYDDPEVAEADIIEHYRKLTPQQRLDEMMELLNKFGGWNERRLERVAQFIEIPER